MTELSKSMLQEQAYQERQYLKMKGGRDSANMVEFGFRIWM